MKPLTLKDLDYMIEDLKKIKEINEKSREYIEKILEYLKKQEIIKTASNIPKLFDIHLKLSESYFNLLWDSIKMTWSYPGGLCCLDAQSLYDKHAIGKKSRNCLAEAGILLYYSEKLYFLLFRIIAELKKRDFVYLGDVDDLRKLLDEIMLRKDKTIDTLYEK